MQIIIWSPNGFFILFILGAQVGGGGAKIKKLFEKVKAFLQIKINCTKVLKCDIYIIQLQLKNIFKHLLWNHWANWTQISYGAILGHGNKSFFKWSWSHDQDGHHAHIW